MPVKSGSESDLRFVYCACCISYILDDWRGINTESMLKFIRDCMVGFLYAHQNTFYH